MTDPTMRETNERPAAIAMEGVVKSYGGRPVLHDLAWQVEAGSIHGLMGANGAGKSTLLRLAAGILWPDRGSIRVDGRVLGRENAPLRQSVHYVASGRSLVPGFRVGEWIRYASLAYDHWDGPRAARLVRAMELDPDATIGQLSTGMQLMLQLAVSVACHPRIMLLDEPTNGLDIVMKRQMLQLLIDMAAESGTTIVIATHNVDDLERLADSVAMLYQGHFVVQGRLDAVKGSMARLQVAWPGEWPEALMHDPSVRQVERTGSVAVVTIEGDAEAAKARFRGAGAVLVEQLEMPLEDVIRALLEKEGYTRDAVTWNAAAGEA